ELHLPAGDFYRFPPVDVRVQHASQVVLVDLIPVERPAVVLVLSQVKPRRLLSARPRALLEARAQPDVKPAATERARFWRTLTDPSLEEGHRVTGQQGLELVDLGFLDSALRN